MIYATIDIGSNTTRLLAADAEGDQLRKVMEQRAYTRIGKDVKKGKISAGKIAEVAEVCATQLRLAEEVGAESIRIVATAAVRDAKNSKQAVKEISRATGEAVEVLSEDEEGRLAFLGATKTLGYAVEGKVAVVDVGGGSTEIVLGTVDGGVEKVRSVRVGTGYLAEELLESDPPSPAEIRAVRDRVADLFEGVEVSQPDQAVAVGGSASSLRKVVGAVLEYETLERAVRVLTGEPIADVARMFELDPRRVEVLPAGVLILEQLSQLLGQPLQIGKGGLREGVLLDQLLGGAAPAAA
jgi:exopolyphosphatase/guanosine-5'-triphosphate,3'-diphosphate pyrophosphatase